MLDSVFEPFRASPVPLAHRFREPNFYSRAAAVSSPEQGSHEVSLASIWAQLALGALEVVDDFSLESRCYLVVRHREAVPLRSNEQRAIRVLKRVLLEGCQKVAGYELKIKPSSVAELSRVGLTLMGLHCRVSATPCLLVAAAHASEDDRAAKARSSLLHCDDGSLQVLSVVRPDMRIVGLPPAVLDVLRALVEGKSRALIASERKTSVRTVANQLNSAFKQLRATSRLDLLRLFYEPTRSPALATIMADESWPDRSGNACTNA